MSPSREPEAAIRELEETLRAADASDQKELAYGLFAHGLMRERAELAKSGAQFRAEARVHAVMDRLRGNAAPAKSRASIRQHPLFRLGGLAAAAVVVVAVVLQLAGRRRWTPAYASDLLERAVSATSEGIHVYEATVEWGRTRIRRSSWVVALGPSRQFHVRTTRGTDAVPTGFQWGSDGKVVWIRSAQGYGLELPLVSPQRFDVTGLEPVLGYYQVVPFLEAILEDVQIEVTGRETTDSGTVVTVAGRYRYASPLPTWRPVKQTKHNLRRSLFGDTGQITLRVQEETGELLLLRVEQEAPEREVLEVERLPTPQDLAAAGIDFDPPRGRTAPELKLLTWLAAVGTEIWWRNWGKERMRERLRAREGDEGGGKR